MTDQVLRDIVEGSITHAARSGSGFAAARSMAFEQLQHNGIDANYDFNEVDAALNEAYGVEGTPKALGDLVPEAEPALLRPGTADSDFNALADTPKPLGVLPADTPLGAPAQKPLGQKLPE